MHLNPEQFEKKHVKNRLAISLIGMSNAGKSFWGKKLAAIGFEYFSCDDFIEKQLEPELKKSAALS